MGATLGKAKKTGAGRRARRTSKTSKTRGVVSKSATHGKPRRSSVTRTTTRRKAVRKAAKKVTKKVSKKVVAAATKRLMPKALDPTLSRFTVRELDPIRKCGPGTSVRHLYRIDERCSGQRDQVHLVFFDRHGWYCEHGRDCVAVSYARKYGDPARQHGPTHNGRMRA